EPYQASSLTFLSPLELYNNQGKIDQKNCGLSTLLVRYNLENDEGTWKIANSRTLKSLVRR
ncbi:MAG: hypothetical protein RLZZ339_489, partial [Cyanobacteriota bacterium]